MKARQSLNYFRQLLRCFLVRQDVAGLGGAVRIQSDPAFVDVLDDSVLIDYEGRAIAEALLFIEDSIILHYGSFEIA
ncbi:MAG: hypothetical protein QOF72_1202 [Blastocatellia bacterium]|nr:hypothetical protein [Blastocatellia bacterium]MDX6576788.1 hypothetical protein [Blastocatellia bacterium]